MQFSGKIWLMIISKFTKIQSFILSLEDTFLKNKNTGGFKLTPSSYPPAFLGLKCIAFQRSKNDFWSIGQSQSSAKRETFLHALREFNSARGGWSLGAIKPLVGDFPKNSSDFTYKGPILRPVVFFFKQSFSQKIKLQVGVAALNDHLCRDVFHKNSSASKKCFQVISHLILRPNSVILSKEELRR